MCLEERSTPEEDVGKNGVEQTPEEELKINLDTYNESNCLSFWDFKRDEFPALFPVAMSALSLLYLSNFITDIQRHQTTDMYAYTILSILLNH